MRILALETIGTSGSVAACQAGQLLCSRRLDERKRSAVSLAPAVRELLADVGWRPADVELVAVATGPGSFTGLRVGVTTAKVFAYAVNAQIVGVNSLEVIAEQAPPPFGRLWPLLDAHRNQLFAACYARAGNGPLHAVVPAGVVEIERFSASLAAGDLLTGPGVVKLAGRLSAGVAVLPEEHWTPTAAAVGRLAWRRFAAGGRDDVWSLVPQYYRKSAAEEQRQAAGEPPKLP